MLLVHGIMHATPEQAIPAHPSLLDMQELTLSRLYYQVVQ